MFSIFGPLSVDYMGFCGMTRSPHILGCLVWSCHWSVETWTGSLAQTQEARCFGTPLCTPPGWAPAWLRRRLDQWRLSCSGEEAATGDIHVQEAKKQTRNKHSIDGRGSGCWVVSPPTFDLTTLLTLSFKVTSTAVSLAAMVLLSWPVTGSRLLEMAEDGTELRRQINKSERVIKDAAEKNGNNLSWY